MCAINNDEMYNNSINQYKMGFGKTKLEQCCCQTLYQYCDIADQYGQNV